MLTKKCNYCGKKNWLGFDIRKKLLWTGYTLHFCNEQCAGKYVESRNITWKEFNAIFGSVPK